MKGCRLILSMLLEASQTIAFGLQITIEGAHYASSLLNRLCQQMASLVMEENADDFQLVDLAIESASNLLSSLLFDNPTSFTVYEMDVRNDLVMKSLDYVETLLTVCLRDACLTCCPYSLIHSFIHSGYSYRVSSSPLLLRGTSDYSIDTVLEFTRLSTTGNCE